MASFKDWAICAFSWLLRARIVEPVIVARFKIVL